MKQILPIALLISLSGCAATMVQPGGGGAYGGYQPEPELSDLSFGIHWIGGTDSNWAAKHIQRVSGLPNVVGIQQERNNPDIDVIVRITYISSPTSLKVETFTAKKRTELTAITASWWTQHSGWTDISRHLKTEFAPDTPLYNAVVAERDEAPAIAGAGAAAGLTKQDIADIVKQAVGAQAQAPAQPSSAQPRSSVDRPRYKAAERPDDFAVVIGIDKYSDLPAASYAERDAAAVRDHLAALGLPERNIVSLTGSKAGKAAFMKTLETWLPKQVGPESTVWIYYSGHGAPDPKSGQAFLLPWDGDPQFLDDTGYSLKRLYGKLNALPAKRVIVALDSCFSGAGGRSVLAKGLRPLVTKIDTGVAGEKIVVLTASSAEQVSGTAESEGHGLFTYHLLAGLNGEAADGRGRVTLQGLYDYLSPKVADDARRQNRDQAPQLLPKREAAGSVLLR